MPTTGGTHKGKMDELGMGFGGLGPKGHSTKPAFEARVRSHNSRSAATQNQSARRQREKSNIRKMDNLG